MVNGHGRMMDESSYVDRKLIRSTIEKRYIARMQALKYPFIKT